MNVSLSKVAKSLNKKKLLAQNVNIDGAMIGINLTNGPDIFFCRARNFSYSDYPEVVFTGLLQTFSMLSYSFILLVKEDEGSKRDI